MSLIERAHFFSQNQNSQFLQNKIVANVFYEPSTRTRCSFEIAAKRMAGEVVNFVPESSSVKKGETIYDTLKSLESLGLDALILRHSDDHVFEELIDKINAPLINAGAGKHEHPTQGLLDLLTLHQEFKKFEGLKIVICGDIKHSRVAGSMMIAAEKLGMEISLCGPDSLIPQTNKSFIKKVPFDEAIKTADAVMMLRIQLERHESLELNAKTYHQEFGMTHKRAQTMKETAIIMHPGPFNRGVEISDEMVEDKKSRIFKQMSNGVFARMAVLEWAIKGSR